MLQPFVKFEQRCLNKIISLKKTYVVSQSYSRAFNHLAEHHKIDILFTEYDDPGLATIHLNAVKDDRYAALIDLSKPAHLKKIEEMMKGETYSLYWSVIKSAADLSKKLDSGYKAKLRKYIEEKTSWRIPVQESIISQFEVRFGELIIILKWRTQKVRLKFEEIERY